MKQKGSGGGRRTPDASREAREADQDTPDETTASRASVRHALRTPLNHIIGYSELLLEEAKERGLEDMVTDLRNIHAAGKELLALINQLFNPAVVYTDPMPFRMIQRPEKQRVRPFFDRPFVDMDQVLDRVPLRTLMLARKAAFLCGPLSGRYFKRGSLIILLGGLVADTAFRKRNSDTGENRVVKGEPRYLLRALVVPAALNILLTLAARALVPCPLGAEHRS